MPTYGLTGSIQSFVVPAGVYGYHCILFGANGEGSDGTHGVAGRTIGDLAVTPGQTIYYVVGGKPDGNVGGFNGGGSGATTLGQGGGGATDIRVGGTALANRVAVAGGGGGRGSSGNFGGVGGGLVGGNGTGSEPGLGGTALAGGAAGGSGTSGTLGNGGTGEAGDTGGGGGGYYGGGGGGNPGSGSSGGGGGSSYYGGLTSADTTSGYAAFGDGNGSISFTVISKVPNQPTPTFPVANAYIGGTVTNRFTYDYDVDTDQPQTAQSLRYRVVGAGSWTTVSATTANEYHDFASGTFTAGSSYEWQVLTTNAAGDSVWSASAFFRAATPPPAPVITAPTLNSDVETGDTVNWTVTNQTYFQFRRVKDTAGSPDPTVIYEDTGTVVDSATRSKSLMFTVNNRYEHLQVRVFYNTLWSAWTSRRVHALANRPLEPIVHLTAHQDTASIDIAWSTPPPGAGDSVVDHNEIWVIDFDTWVRLAANLGPSGTFTYRTPRSGQDYDLRIRVIAVAVDGSTSEGLPSGAIGTPYGTGPYGTGPYGE